MIEVVAGLGGWLLRGIRLCQQLDLTIGDLTAIEADPQRFKKLKSHLADNKIEPKMIECLNYAVGAKMKDHFFGPVMNLTGMVKH